MKEIVKVYFRRQEDVMEGFEKHLRSIERAENTIKTYLGDIREYYKWLGQYNDTYKVYRSNVLDYKRCLDDKGLIEKALIRR